MGLAIDRWGREEVLRRCARLSTMPGDAAVTGPDLDLAMVLGSVSDRDWLAAGRPPGNRYWARVWAVRALLYVWPDQDHDDDNEGEDGDVAAALAAAVLAALGDEQWRVRELAARVVKARELGQAAGALEQCLHDPVPRVRIAAARGLATVGEAEQAPGLHQLRADPEPQVTAAAVAALHTLSRRLDRQLG